MLKKIFAVFVSLVSLLFILPSNTQAKDYSITSADFKVQINTDGSANVTEVRTYNFDGTFTWADEWINKKGYRMADFELWEGGKSYLQGSTGVPNTFYVTDESDKVYIKWYYQAASENKTFTLKYVINNAITDQKDISEFYWQLIGNEWDKGVGSVTAKVFLPYPAVNNQIYAFGHGPLNGTMNIVSDREVDFAVSDLPPKTFFEVRVLFPTNPSFFYTRTGNESLASILSEEKSFQNKNKNLKTGIGALAIISALVVLWRMILWCTRWYKYGRDDWLPQVNLAGTLHEPPSDLAPIYVEEMLKGYTTGVSIVSEILELVRRKILTIEFQKGAKKTLFGNKDKYFLVLKDVNYASKVSDIEKNLLEFLYPDKTTKLDFDEVKNFGRTRQMDTYSFWNKWKSDAAEGLKDMGYFIKESLDYQKKAILELVLVSLFPILILPILSKAGTFNIPIINISMIAFFSTF